MVGNTHCSSYAYSFGFHTTTRTSTTSVEVHFNQLLFFMPMCCTHFEVVEVLAFNHFKLVYNWCTTGVQHLHEE